MVTGQKPPRQKALRTKATRTKTPANMPTRIIVELISKYAVDANLFQLASTNP